MVFVLVLRGYALKFPARNSLTLHIMAHQIYIPASDSKLKEKEKKTSFSISTKAMPQARCFSGPLGIEVGFGLLLQQQH